ncbi:MFS transporter [Paenibacillus sp. TRM 82003]|nr:MFS transporter [Paenibacillus sp. TRM 82003]
MHPELRRNRPFLQLWLAQIASNVGDQFYSISILWYLLKQVESPSALSLFTMPEMIAGFVFTLWFGALADRGSAAKLMIRSDIARMGLVLVVFALMLLGSGALPLFMAVQFGIGLFVALFAPARTVAVRRLVPPALLNEANALQDTTFRTIRIAAPMTVAALAAFVPLHWLVLVNVFAYAISALCIAAAYRDAGESAPPARPAERMTFGKYVRDVRDGFAAMTGNAVLFLTVLFGNVGFLAWQVLWTVGFPVLAARLGEGWLGILVGFYGAGNLLGSLVMTRLNVKRLFHVCIGGWLFLAAGYAVIALGTPTPWLVCLGAALGGIGGPVIGIPLITAIQTLSPPEHTGKIYSTNLLIFTLFCIGSSAIGALGFADLPVEAMFGWGAAFLGATVVIAFAWYARAETVSSAKIMPTEAETL